LKDHCTVSMLLFMIAKQKVVSKKIIFVSKFWRMAKVSCERILTEMERRGSHSREEEEEQYGRANRDRRTDRCTSVASSSEWYTTCNATL
jgi:hypothetical protein